MAEMYMVVVITMMICPITLVAVVVAVILNKLVFRRRYWGYLIFTVIGVLIFFLGYKVGDLFIPVLILKQVVVNLLPIIKWRVPHVGLKEWILSDFRTVGISMITEMICLYLATRTPERVILDKELRREQARMTVEQIDYIPEKSQIIVGVSGSGKTAFIGKSIEEILSKDPTACIIVYDGKGDCGLHSLFEICTVLSKRYRKKLIIINGTANKKLDGTVYDFLDDIETADTMMDMVMALIDNPSIEASAGSEHYRTITASYILTIIEVMRDGKVDVTIKNLASILDPADLKQAIDQMDINPAEKNRIIRLAEDNWQEVRANVEKLKMLLKGQGRSIFTGDGMRTNLRKAYQERAIVIILASELDMPSLASKVFQEGVMDLRALVSGRINGNIDLNDEIYVFMDEFSGFTSSTPLVRSLYQRARSGKTKMTLATQSAKDIIEIDPDWLDELEDNSDRFICFRQNSPGAASAVSEVFMTEHHITSTMRTSDMHLTGEGSHTPDKSFIVHPDMIKRMPINHGFMLDKTGDNVEIKYFKNQFVKY